jgi:hypothetical protein
MFPKGIPGMEPKRRTIDTTGTHVTVGVTPPDFFNLPEQTLTLTTEQYRRYCRWLAHGSLIQTELPELTPSEREILLSGLGDADFHDIASDHEQEDDDELK